MASQILGVSIWLFVQAQIKVTSKIRVTGFCEGNPPVTGPERASNEEHVSIWWRHRVQTMQLFVIEAFGAMD